MLTATARGSNGFQPFNMASYESTTVNEIAELISSEMDLQPEFSHTGGDRGWKGDVRKGHLDTSLLESLGWSPRINIATGVNRYISWLQKEYN